ncbi:ABC transporter permease [Microbacterium pumilum]|uniref:ABC transporter permease n=1 Tax=Microbacterium pumilum TaxID=344165 RepID=A0ABN2T236_9MICO
MGTETRAIAVEVPPRSAVGKIVGIQFAIGAAFVLIWQLIGEVPGVATLIGTPLGTLAQLGEWVFDPEFWGNVATTVMNAFVGFLIGVIGACVFLALTYPIRLVRRFVSPFLAVLNAVPRVALAPLFIVWFGIGSGSSIAFVVAMIFLMIYINIFTGLSTIDQVYVHNAQMLGARGWQLAQSVYIPAVGTWIMSSLRLAAIWSVLGAAVAEYLAGSRGLGGYLARGGVLGEPDMLIAAAIVIAIISLIADALLSRLEKRYARWRLF